MVGLIALILILLPGAAQADPLSAAIASGLSSLGVGAVAATALGQLLGSVLLSRLSMALSGTSGSKLIRELVLPDSLPVWRFVYGKCWAPGTPAGVRVKGDMLYGCWIVNSRPSEGPFTVLLDKRPVVTTGDPYDFAGSGAVATNSPFGDDRCRIWIGKGDQTTCPDLIVSEFPEEFQATDAWQGRTVVWLRLRAGGNKRRAERWPQTPPEVMVDGFWSRVWDPRDSGQDPDDPDTWEWSANQALCVLDALRSNPLTPYDARHLWMELYEWAADAADEAVAVKGGGTIPRYEVNGVLAFSDSAELEDQLQPLLDAGAARFVRARGQLGIIPAVAQDVAATLTDMTDGQAPQFIRYRNRDELATEVSAKYLAPDRAYEEASLPTYVITGAQTADGGLARLIQPDLSLITDHRQGQRVQKIVAMRTRMQRGVSAEFPPVAFDLVAGSWAALDLPAPFEGWNRTYEVESIAPVLTEEEGGGVHLRCPMVLRETSADIYAWNAATEEQDVEEYEFDGTLPVLQPPGAITVVTGATVALRTGYGIISRVRFAFDPSTSASVTEYEWQYRVDGGSWTSGGVIDGDVRDGSDDVFGFVSPASPGATYAVRVRAIAPGMVSAWVTSADITASSGAERYFADFDAATYEIDGVAVARSDVLQLTRASTATYIDASGTVQTAAIDMPRIDHQTGTGALLIEPAATNLMLHSEALDNAAWTKVRASITANAATAPDGTSTADKLVEDTTASSSHRAEQTRSYTSGQQYTFSVFAKAAERDEVALELQSTAFGATQRLLFDLVTGAGTSQSGTATGGMIELDNGWWRCWITATATATVSALASIRMANGSGSVAYTGDGTSGVYVWGAQFEAGALSSYIPTAGSSATRAADVPAMSGITAEMDLAITYGDATTDAVADAPVGPGYWPALTQTRLRRLVGTP